jgi:hypothetical protein
MLVLQRLPPWPHCTFGAIYVDGEAECFTLEDLPHEPKVDGETRIPAGVYTIELQTVGRLHQKYLARYPEFHMGMLHLVDVPDFTGVMVHQGLDEKDTEGCILVASKAVSGGNLEDSGTAYQAFYKKVVAALAAGEVVKIDVRD